MQLDGVMAKQPLHITVVEIPLPNRGYISFMSCVYVFFA
jgi:hypothetical protein